MKVQDFLKVIDKNNDDQTNESATIQKQQTARFHQKGDSKSLQMDIELSLNPFKQNNDQETPESGAEMADFIVDSGM